MDILWQKDTGFLHAAECVLTHLQLAEQHGATVREQTPVTDIDWQADVPVVRTENGSFHGRKVIVTAGAWTEFLLSEVNLPLTVTKQQVCYYQPADTVRFQGDRFPVFTEATADGEFIYGVPYFGRNGLKNWAAWKGRDRFAGDVQTHRRCRLRCSRRYVCERTHPGTR